jgi:hypothetical protein
MDTRKDQNSTVTYTEIVPNIDPDISWNEKKGRILKLCSLLWPLALDYTCDDKPIVGGYNEVYFTSITHSAGVTQDFVIRCPQETWHFTLIIDCVATLQYIRGTTSIRVPAVVAYDTTRDNPINSRHIILERCRGVSLRTVIDDLTGDQRVAFAEEVGELYNQLRQTSMPYSGRITPSTEGYLPSLRPGETFSHITVKIEPYGARMPKALVPGIPTSGTIGDVDESFFTSSGMTSDPPNLPLETLISRAFDRRLIQATSLYPTHRDMIVERVNLYTMIDAFVKEGRVENASNECCLWHSDLFPRNIMVDVESSPMITGVIDWDDAVYAPKFVAAVAPTWLWELPENEDLHAKEEQLDKREEGDEDDESSSTDEGPEAEEETFERSNATPPTVELQEVRTVWEDAVGSECAKSARDHRHILARRILRFALAWQWEDWWYDLYYDTLAEWRTLQQALPKSATDLNGPDSSDSSPKEENGFSETLSSRGCENVVEDDGDSASGTYTEAGTEYHGSDQEDQE